MKNYYNLFFVISLMFTPIHGRNHRRPQDKTTPTITVSASNPSTAKTWVSPKIQKNIRLKSIHTFQNAFLRIKPIKGFNEEFFQKHYLPSNTRLNFRNNDGSVRTNQLEQLAQGLVEELKAGQTVFTHFKILKDKDFSYKTLSGLLVVKFKDYPFVLKLSIEHPHTMVEPYGKSFEASCIFFIGGNIRHLSNFTRISNLEYIKKILSYNPYYLENLDFPRKWYWKPKNNYNLLVTWKGSKYKDEEVITMPSIYGVITDFIDTIDWPQQDLNKISMRVAADVGFALDPHAGNFVREKDREKYTLVDTEDFRLMTGIDHTMKSKRYIGWYLELAGKAIQTYGGRNKKERIRQCYDLI